MRKLRFGIVGMGTMGGPHARNIVKDRNRNFCLTAVSDAVAERARRIGKELNVPYFTDTHKMYDSGLVDAVIIVTPHYQHAPLTIRAARRGLHVLCEKPLSSSVSHARAMIAECRKHKVNLGAMLQQRTTGVTIKARSLVKSGALGEVFRVQMICSNWFRSQAYYDSGAWRGTWDGEGGGVLINQAPHSLDLFQWIGLGLPKRVIATLATREHKIEVEDTADILCDYGDGKIGYIYASTADEPGMNQIIVSGDKATMKVEDNKILLGKLKVPTAEHVYGSKNADAVAKPMGAQTVSWREIRYPDRKSKTGHIEVIRGFARDVLRGTGQYAPGNEAINELELSNAAYLSGFNNSMSVELPVDGARMDRLLARLEREHSTGKGNNMRTKYEREFRKLMKSKVKKTKK